MQIEKPKVAPRPSRKKPETGEILSEPEIKPPAKPPLSAKPTVSSKPILQKNEPSEIIQTTPNKPEVKPQAKEDPEVRDLAVKITKIGAPTKTPNAYSEIICAVSGIDF